ncbi:dihydrofolate reductase [Diaporthe amygdali]|uniref:dihydrofolate reductase n=1 Tax=Phomopsis amygdali TaxID=1214568 RepID=UPI0022FED5F8|nr:dihydrofolate reductase [Diaporthe amygdali]KAJ0108607.1 dihydrofolate reductase [Diaporthe amygdali]
MSVPASENAMLPLELTLVLAATRDMGIGLRGTLPWTGLKKEMAYFARVTKRLPPQVEPPVMNAVIMGRKTWESIPPKFRPLKGRLNVVISRSFGPSPEEPSSVETDPVKASSLEQAIAYLQQKPQGSLGRVFVIGGGQIYAAALQMKEARRVLLTKVMSDFECDTFFSLKLDGEGESSLEWAKRSKQELDSWTGEVVPDGIQVENDTSYEFQMWERTN